ncbi:hypothetical protein [Microbacterium lacticum]|nr:hypothetical protein [Microbacterium lacticum]
MSERFIVTSRAGESVVRTNDQADAERWQRILGGEVIDREAVLA